MADNKRDYLRRLPPENYRGHAYVHWSMTIDGRREGWLSPVLHYQYREIMAHTAFRYGLCCPIYCIMPDHFHLLWIGVQESCDQRNAVKFFRAQMNKVLSQWGVSFQQQPYDHVLREDERERGAIEAVAEYIALNPVRAGLVPQGEFREYPYTGCLLPGYPDLSPWEVGYWEKFWHLHALMCSKGK